VKIIDLKEIKRLLQGTDPVPLVAEGFAAYSAGRAVIPPVGELLFDHGDVHVKYGYIKDDEFYVIKIASGFYNNPQYGLPSSNGLMLLFKQATGELAGILLDEGYLTNIRTAAAGAIAARHLAPKHVERIGIVGAGTQARLQLLHLKPVTDCRRALVWGRDRDKLKQYQAEMSAEGFIVETTLDADEVLKPCNLVVTTTPSTQPLLHASALHPGVHITAMGSDTADKQELDSAILARADLVVADSISQCLSRGEIFRALTSGHLRQERVVELGRIISGDAAGRTSESQITVADLTGLATQDIQIATLIYRKSLAA
jgi:ornithine cyclodeaminase